MNCHPSKINGFFRVYKRLNKKKKKKEKKEDEKKRSFIETIYNTIIFNTIV